MQPKKATVVHYMFMVLAVPGSESLDDEATQGSAGDGFGEPGFAGVQTVHLSTRNSQSNRRVLDWHGLQWLLPYSVFSN